MKKAAKHIFHRTKNEKINYDTLIEIFERPVNDIGGL